MAKKEKSQAAEKVAKAEKAHKASKQKSDKPIIFVRMGKAITRFFKDFRGETKKIVWPAAKTVLKSTGVVLAVVAIVGLAIFLIDTGLSRAVSGLEGLADRETTTQAAPVETTAPAVTTTAPAVTTTAPAATTTAPAATTTAPAATTTAPTP